MRSRLITGFLLLWLPFQAWAAGVMPFCGHAMDCGTPAMTCEQSTNSNPAEMSSDQAPGSDPQSNPQPVDVVVNECDACDLSDASAVGNALRSSATPATGARPHTALRLLSLFDPERLDRPPLV